MAVTSKSKLGNKKIIEYFQSTQGKIVLGIEGIKDEVWQVVETRLSKNECKTFDTVKSYAEYILQRSEGGMAMEMLRKRIGFGGFTGNIGYALGILGCKPTLLGMYGNNDIDPAFAPLVPLCELISVGEPAVCHVMEFSDGKIMQPYLSNLLHFGWDDLVSAIGMEKLETIFRPTDIFAFGYWSNLYAFDELLTHIYRHFLADSKAKRVFHDFANIKKRSVSALKTSLELMASLDGQVPMTLSLNEHEAALLFQYYNKPFTNEEEILLEALLSLRQVIGIDEIIIHTPHFSAGASAKGDCAVHKQTCCDNPVRTAGAGDTFNAGYMAASLGNLTLYERIAVANAATLFFVTNGFPPSKDDLCESVRI